jgi:hypothetical protein
VDQRRRLADGRGQASRSALPRPGQGSPRGRCLPRRPGRASLPDRPSACRRLGHLQGRGGSLPGAVGPGEGARRPEAALRALSGGAGRGADPHLLVGSQLLAGKRRPWPWEGRSRLCRGLRFPCRRLPLPDAVRSERRLSPERERRNAAAEKLRRRPTSLRASAGRSGRVPPGWRRWRPWSKKRQVSRVPTVRPRRWTHKAIDSRPFALSLRQEADLIGDRAPLLVFVAQEIGRLLGRLSGIHDRTDRGNPLDQLRFGKR